MKLARRPAILISAPNASARPAPTARPFDGRDRGHRQGAEAADDVHKQKPRLSHFGVVSGSERAVEESEVAAGAEHIRPARQHHRSGTRRRDLQRLEKRLEHIPGERVPLGVAAQGDDDHLAVQTLQLDRSTVRSGIRNHGHQLSSAAVAIVCRREASASSSSRFGKLETELSRPKVTCTRVCACSSDSSGRNRRKADDQRRT